MGNAAFTLWKKGKLTTAGKQGYEVNFNGIQYDVYPGTKGHLHGFPKTPKGKAFKV